MPSTRPSRLCGKIMFAFGAFVASGCAISQPAHAFPFDFLGLFGSDKDGPPPDIVTAPDQEGPPGGQTRIGNLNKLTRRHHRLKTHGGWQLAQPFPGIWIWRSPHGRHYLVDHTGTTPLGKTA